MWDLDSRREVLLGLTEQALKVVWDAMAESRMQHGGEWSITLPDFWAAL